MCRKQTDPGAQTCRTGAWPGLEQAAVPGLRWPCPACPGEATPDPPPNSHLAAAPRLVSLWATASWTRSAKAALGVRTAVCFALTGHLVLTLGTGRSKADLNPCALTQAKLQHLDPEKGPPYLICQAGAWRTWGGGLALPGATRPWPPAPWGGPGVYWKPAGPSRSQSTNQEAQALLKTKAELLTDRHVVAKDDEAEETCKHRPPGGSAVGRPGPRCKAQFDSPLRCAHEWGPFPSPVEGGGAQSTGSSGGSRAPTESRGEVRTVTGVLGALGR